MSGNENFSLYLQQSNSIWEGLALLNKPLQMGCCRIALGMSRLLCSVWQAVLFVETSIEYDLLPSLTTCYIVAVEIGEVSSGTDGRIPQYFKSLDKNWPHLVVGRQKMCRMGGRQGRG